MLIIVSAAAALRLAWLLVPVMLQVLSVVMILIASAAFTDNTCLQEDEENGIGDVDLFTLSEGKDEITVNAKWLQHLQVCALLCCP